MSIYTSKQLRIAIHYTHAIKFSSHTRSSIAKKSTHDYDYDYDYDYD